MKTPPISIEALMVIDAIAYRGSYAAAAEQLTKVPSALSYIVQKLEEQLSVTLFQRQGRRAVLTPAGKHLLLEGRKVLQAVSLLSEQTQTIANGWEPKIRIACDTIVDIKPIYTGIETFLAEHQNIEIDVQEEVMNGTWEALIDDRVDLVIGAPAPVPNQKGIRAVSMGQLNNVLVVSSAHALAEHFNQQHKRQPMAVHELGSYRNVIVHDSAQHEIPWSINVVAASQHCYVSSVAHKIAAIVAGIGFGNLPNYLAAPYIESGQLMVIELVEQAAAQDIFMAWKITNKGKGLDKLKAILLAEKASISG